MTNLLFNQLFSLSSLCRLEMENELPTIPFPMCIIPDGKKFFERKPIEWPTCLGTTNIISHTIQGNTDHYTPLLHLILSR